MIHDDVKMDLSKTLSIQQNLKKSIIVSSGSAFVSALLFLVAFIATRNPWLIAASFVLVVGGIAYAILVKKIEHKYLDKDGNLKNVQ